MKHVGWKIQCLDQVPEEILGCGEVDTLEKSDGQLAPPQFPISHPAPRSRLASPAPVHTLMHTHTC